MKKIFICDIKNFIEKEIELFGWIKAKRVSKTHAFFDIEDSSGCIQAVISREIVSDDKYCKIDKTKLESAVKVFGKVISYNNHLEIKITTFDVIGEVKIDLSPKPRSDFDFLILNILTLS